MFTPALVNRILDRAAVARLAQIDLDGHAQALPFVFCRLDGCLWSPIDGKPKKRPLVDRLRWLAENPHVLVLVDHYDDDWSALWWLKLYGTATVEHVDHPRWAAAAAGLARKYPQYDDVEMFLGEPTMVCITIDRWKSWASAGDANMERHYAV